MCIKYIHKHYKIHLSNNVHFSTLHIKQTASVSHHTSFLSLLPLKNVRLMSFRAAQNRGDHLSTNHQPQSASHHVKPCGQNGEKKNSNAPCIPVN